MKTYAEKLKNPRWQRKRLEIFERDDFKCQVCLSAEKTLHVHHVRYLNGHQPWEYKNFYLVTLCHECHEAEEAEIQRCANPPKPEVPPAPERPPIFHPNPEIRELLEQDRAIKDELKVPGVSRDRLIELLHQAKATSNKLRELGAFPSSIYDENLPPSTFKPKVPAWKKERGKFNHGR